MPTDATRLTLRDYLIPLRARWWFVVLIVVVITGAVYEYERTRPVVYTATTQVYVTNSGAAATNVVSVSDEATLLTSNEVAAVVAKKIGYQGSPGGLAGSVTVTPSATTDFVTISSTQATSAEAALVANAFAREFIARNTAALQAANNGDIASLQQQVAALKAEKGNPANKPQILSDQQQIQQLQLANNGFASRATQIDVATGGAPSASKATKYAALAGVVALIGAILLVYMLYRLDPRLQRVGQAADIYSHPLLATVVHDSDILHFENGRPGLSPKSREAFRDLRIGLNIASPDQRFKTVIVTSAAPGEGKSTVSRNFAIALAEAGIRVALVDADLRKSSLAKKLGAESRPGITEVIAGVNTLDEVKQEIPILTEVIPGLEEMIAKLGARPDGLSPLHASVTLIPAGTTPPNPSAVLESGRFRDVLAQLASEYEVVVVDTTPITAVSDAMPLIGVVDAVLLVARSGATDRRTAQRASELIERVPGSNIVGVVVNGVPGAEAAAYGSGYGYGYGYGYENEPRKRARANRNGAGNPPKGKGGTGGAQQVQLVPVEPRQAEAAPEYQPNGDGGEHQHQNGDGGYEHPSNGDGGYGQPPNGDGGYGHQPDGDGGYGHQPDGEITWG